MHLRGGLCEIRGKKTYFRMLKLVEKGSIESSSEWVVSRSRFVVEGKKCDFLNMGQNSPYTLYNQSKWCRKGQKNTAPFLALKERQRSRPNVWHQMSTGANRFDQTFPLSRDLQYSETCFVIIIFVMDWPIEVLTGPAPRPPTKELLLPHEIKTCPVTKYTWGGQEWLQAFNSH